MTSGFLQLESTLEWYIRESRLDPSILVPRGVFESYIFCWQHLLFTIKLQISVSSVKRQIQNRKIS
jgi:hypothetical protein